MIKDLSTRECLELLGANYIGRLAYIAHDSPYVIPITYYYYNRRNNSIISYSLEGHKIDAMRKKQSVSLEIDEIESVKHWKSVLVHGEYEELSGIDAKKLLHEFSAGVKEIVNRKKGKDVAFIHEFSSKLASTQDPPVVYRIRIDKVTGKERVD